MGPLPAVCVDALAGAGKAPPPRVRYPSWMDGRFALETGEFVIGPAFAVGGGPVVKTNADSARYVIGFVTSALNTASVSVSPHPDPFNWPWIVMVPGQFFSWTLFGFGPVVCGEWYLFATAPQQVRLVESKTR